MKIFKKQNVQTGELAMYEVLNTIADQYNAAFSTLRLPKASVINHENSVISMPFYEGKSFNEKWTMSNGGVPLGLDLSAEVPRMIKDLSIVDIRWVLNSSRLKNMPKIQFNHGEYLKDFEKLCDSFTESGIITETERDMAIVLLKEGFASPLILNNGDFYPPNFIRMQDEKIALIDWETWNEHSRAYILDHPENVAAYCFVDMWGNGPWQKNFIRELRKLFNVGREDFQKAILMKSADIAIFWLGGKEAADPQQSPMALFKKALTEEYMDWLWS